MKSLIYCRFSPRPNAAECQSNEMQADECRKFCASQGWEVMEPPFEDRGKSGADPERPGLWAAVDTLAKGDVLVAHRWDRLARDANLAHAIVRAVEKKKARVTSTDGRAVGENASPEDKLIWSVLGAFAEYERHLISIRTRLAKQRQQSRGYLASHDPPYGYTVDPDNPDRLTQNPDEYPWLSKTFELHYLEGMGCAAIAKRLEAAGAPPRGKKWHAMTVYRLIERMKRNGNPS